MDDSTCPHCGSPLPLVRDAFCSACHEPLDEPPETPRTAEEKAAFLTATNREARQTIFQGTFRSLEWLRRLFRLGSW